MDLTNPQGNKVDYRDGCIINGKAIEQGFPMRQRIKGIYFSLELHLRDTQEEWKEENMDR